MTILKEIDSRALELTIISAESLSLKGKRSVKKNAYAVVKTQRGDHFATGMDPENGAYPSWNHKFSIHMPMHEPLFTLEVRCNYSSCGGDHAIGSVRVPVSDFTAVYFPCNYLHFLSYRLRDRYGERNGIINLSVKVKQPAGATTSSAYSSPVAGGWKYGGAAAMGKGQGGVAFGVPVGKQY
ncbi:BON1-associated protein 2-like [Bidens hawaiensis]|uniref:BON1-associated protein 2-like n=1 Tax=Bidens hawaiensis TaxID=980011 RepID=UPI00404AA53B